jgi:hypothetical protein
VLVAGGLDSIVINNQTEEDRTGSMGIEILRGRRRLLDRGQRWRSEKTFYRRSEMRGVAIDGSSGTVEALARVASVALVSDC